MKGIDVGPIEADEYWDAPTRGDWGGQVAAMGYRTWMHFTPDSEALGSPHGSWCYGLALQTSSATPSSVRAKIVEMRAIWQRPIILAEVPIQTPPQDRWRAYQVAIEVGAVGGTHVGYI